MSEAPDQRGCLYMGKDTKLYLSKDFDSLQNVMKLPLVLATHAQKEDKTTNDLQPFTLT